MEFMREKEEKKKLEQRIAMLMGQMIRGDGNNNSNNGISGTSGSGSNTNGSGQSSNG